MFEIERLDKGYQFRLGSKGKLVKIDQAGFDRLYRASVAMLRIVKVSDVDEIYQGLQTLNLDPKVRKVKVVGGYVVQQAYEGSTIELPPEGDSGAEE